MTDVHSPEQRSYNMSRIRSGDTKPELLVRRILHAAGLRYRLHAKNLPGKPDLVFAGARAVVFVHGCFWHMHKCRYGKPAPTTNQEFWAQKRRGNAERDVRNRRALRAEGWKVFEIWECDTRDLEKLMGKLGPVVAYVRSAIGNRRDGRPTKQG